MFLDENVSDTVKTQVGQAIADKLDTMAHHPADFADATSVARYARLLDAVDDDPRVMAPMYQRLGADGLLGTLNGIASAADGDLDDKGLADLAEHLRDGLQAATRAEGFDGEAFGERLVRYTTGTAGADVLDAYHREYPSTSMDAAVLDFVLSEGDYGEDFVRGAAWQLDEFERAAGATGVETWLRYSGAGWPLDGTDGDLHNAALGLPDPMSAAMVQLGEHPALGLEFFTRTRTGTSATSPSATGAGTASPASHRLPSASGPTRATWPPRPATTPRRSSRSSSTGSPRTPTSPRRTPPRRPNRSATCSSTTCPPLRWRPGTRTPGLPLPR